MKNPEKLTPEEAEMKIDELTNLLVNLMEIRELPGIEARIAEVNEEIDEIEHNIIIDAFSALDEAEAKAFNEWQAETEAEADED